MRFAETARDLAQRYRSVDVDALDMSDYVKGYIRSYQQEIEAVLQRYVYLLEEGSRRLNKGTDYTFMDFGGGTGVFSLLAKSAGITKVCYVDISQEMAQGAREMARVLAIPVDEFLVASYENLTEITDLRADLIANYDVLEHIYRPVEAFAALQRQLNPGGLVMMASGANAYNPVIAVMYHKKHHISETVGTVYGKEMDCKEPFLNVRKTIISEYSDQLDAGEIEQLAESTRGMRQGDIESAVTVFLATGNLPQPAHRSNTCDPLTGNGDENLLDVYQLKKNLQPLFADVQIATGRYATGQAKFAAAPDIKEKNLIRTLYPYLNYLARLLGPLLNAVMSLLPLRLRLIIAPYYIITGRSI
jgi:ubiquinone/menaquinone biosynthesis C-methylase UbiE